MRKGSILPWSVSSKLGGASYRRYWITESRKAYYPQPRRKNNQPITRRHRRRRGFAPQLINYN